MCKTPVKVKTEVFSSGSATTTEYPALIAVLHTRHLTVAEYHVSAVVLKYSESAIVPQ